MLLSALLVLVGLVANVAAQPTTPTRGLFLAEATGVAADGHGLASNAPTVLRQRLARVDHEILQAARVHAGRYDALPTVLRLNFFTDTVLDVVINRTGPTSAGYWLTGQVGGWTLGTATLVVNGEVIAGTVRDSRATYTIRSVGDGVHAIRQLDAAAVPPLGDDVARPRPQPRPPRHALPIHEPDLSLSSAGPGRHPPEDGSRVDLLMVYTPAARERVGGTQEIRALIDLLLANTHQAYADSGIRTRLNLAAVTEVDYDEAGSTNDQMATRLVDPSDGHLDELHAWRNRTKADIVGLLIDIARSAAGATTAHLDPRRPSAESRGWVWFGVGYDAWWESLVFAHEMGHLLGVQHDRYHSKKNESRFAMWTDPLFPWAFGYVNQRAFDPGAQAASRWLTIMAYPAQCQDAGFECTHLMRFSNPSKAYGGDPLGVPGSKPSSSVDGPSDARRVHNEMSPYVANFRVAPCLRDGARVRLQASNGQYMVAVGNGGGEVRADRQRPGAWGRFIVVDRNGGCVESGDVVSLHTTDGFFLRARRGGGSTLDATAPRATPWARFVVRRERSRRGAVRIRDTVSLQARSGAYVAAAQGGGGTVTADRPRVGSWGRFGITAIR